MKRKLSLFITCITAILSLVISGGGSNQQTASTTQADGSSAKIKVGYYGGTCEAPIFVA